MSEQVQRFWSHEARNIRCVREADYDALHAEAEALRAENAKLRAALAEQGERQEVWARQCDLDESDPALFVARERVEESGYTVRLTTDPQPGPDVRALAAFALEMIDGAWDGGSFDGCDIQDAGVRHGLLAVEQCYESCGEHCDCAEYGFPSECYRLTPALAAHRHTQQGDSNDT